MIPVLAVAGGVAEAVAWALVARRRLNVWAGLGVVLGVAGLAALLTGRVHLSPRVRPWLSSAAGIGAGVALFGATRAFVAVVSPAWPGFRRHVSAIYGQQGRFTRAATMGAALAAVVGEELFWRGLVQAEVGASLGTVEGALLSWLAYVGSNLPSANLPIVAGALVGGATWGALSLWTGGVLASLCCHAAWTELMIAFPPAGSRRLDGHHARSPS